MAKARAVEKKVAPAQTVTVEAQPIDQGRAEFVSRSILVRLNPEQFSAVMRGLLAFDSSLFPPDGEIVAWWLEQTLNPPMIYLRIASPAFDPVRAGEPWPLPIVKPYRDDDGRHWLGNI